MPKEAFCLLLWLSNGGDVDPDGNPTGPPVTGLCEACEDCARCGIMEEALSKRAPGTTYLWVCPDCLNEALAASKVWDIRVQAPGYYSSGYCQRPQCRRTLSDKPEIQFSHFLQVLIITGDLAP